MPPAMPVARLLCTLVLAFVTNVAPAQPTLTETTSTEPTSDAAAWESAPLEGQALKNLCAWARLSAVVEQFCPANESLMTEWLTYRMAAMDAIERALDDDALVEALLRAVAPIAPAVDVWAGDRADGPPGFHAEPTADAVYVGIVHEGRGADFFGTPAGGGMYRSRIVRERPKASKRELSDPPAASVFELCEGVWARVPTVPVDNGDGTLPRPTAEPMVDRPPTGMPPPPTDRSARLAGVMRAWGVLRHFYPYFDVVDTDFEATLPDVLAGVSAAADFDAYADAVERMAAALHDGHAMVWRPGLDRMLAFYGLWIDDQLVVAQPMPQAGDLRPSDVVVSIAGEPVDELAASLRPRISASTQGFADVRLVQRLAEAGHREAVPVEVVRAGERVSLELATVTTDKWWAFDKGRPETGAELAPGVVYVNLCGAKWEDVEPHMPELVAAKGVVFDVRGYPDSAGVRTLAHLTGKRLRCACWRVPRLSQPYFEGVVWDESRWPVVPIRPRIKGRVVFLTDASAISYAETCMAIVEAYDLGTIVGSTTAGTNGNVNGVFLPGPMSVAFTGMRVVKHDGETVHQGVGVIPDVEVRPTLAGLAAGRDEVLEAGVAVAQGKARTKDKTADDPGPTPERAGED